VKKYVLREPYHEIKCHNGRGKAATERHEMKGGQVLEGSRESVLRQSAGRKGKKPLKNQGCKKRAPGENRRKGGESCRRKKGPIIREVRMEAFIIKNKLLSGNIGGKRSKRGENRRNNNFHSRKNREAQVLGEGEAALY